jgi:hypothetical protein
VKIIQYKYSEVSGSHRGEYEDGSNINENFETGRKNRSKFCLKIGGGERVRGREEDDLAASDMLMLFSYPYQVTMLSGCTNNRSCLESHAIIVNMHL